MKKHLKVLEKLENRGLIDQEYISTRKNAFYNHLKKTNESIELKKSVIVRK